MKGSNAVDFVLSLIALSVLAIIIVAFLGGALVVVFFAIALLWMPIRFTIRKTRAMILRRTAFAPGKIKSDARSLALDLYQRIADFNAEEKPLCVAVSPMKGDDGEILSAEDFGLSNLSSGNFAGLHIEKDGHNRIMSFLSMTDEPSARHIPAEYSGSNLLYGVIFVEPGAIAILSKDVFVDSNGAPKNAQHSKLWPENQDLDTLLRKSSGIFHDADEAWAHIRKLVDLRIRKWQRENAEITREAESLEEVRAKYKSA